MRYIYKEVMINKTRSKNHKHILMVMIFTFIWVIFGDLVSIHMDVIFGFERANWNQPFAKTQKTDHKVYKAGSHKAVDSSKQIQFSFIGSNVVEIVRSTQENENLIIVSRLIQFEHDLAQLLRGPPSYC